MRLGLRLREKLLYLSSNSLNARIDGHRIVGQRHCTCPDAPRHSDFAERSLVAQRIAVLQFDHSSIERRAPIEPR